MLGSVQNDFQPAGSIGPELELIFEDPFQEEFEKEEVVGDRYCPGGDLPGDLNSETERLEQDQMPRTADLADRRPVDAAIAGRERPAGAAVPLAQQESVVAPRRAERETLPLHRQQALEEPDDEDMLIVEDDYDHASAATCSIVAVRRQEYGRLFTKLRRG